MSTEISYELSQAFTESPVDCSVRRFGGSLLEFFVRSGLAGEGSRKQKILPSSITSKRRRQLNSVTKLPRSNILSHSFMIH
jgi:hypothetical protein